MRTLPRPRHGRSSGIALVITLCFLALMSVIIIGFMSSARQEFKAGTGYASSASARILADAAVNVVIGQIQTATSRSGESWASQPGMIRVFGDATGRSDKLDALFKLYSSDRMIIPRDQAQDFRFINEVPTGSQGWNHQPALFTDLNEPIRVQEPGSTTDEVKERYPILDPRAFLEKAPDGSPAVEGFDLVQDPKDDSGRLARMPVRWIYMLKDGTLTAPDQADRNGVGAVWSPAVPAEKRPTGTNPIVGRLAFWADDETSKVNINTAGGHTWTRDQQWLQTKGFSYYKEDDFAGSYWDTPRFYNYFDRGGDIDPTTGLIKSGQIGGLALTQPLTNEFQRYPGHPALTSLGLVFKNYLNAEQIYQLSPRLAGGDLTSLGGTHRLINKTYWDPAFPDSRLTGGKPVPIRTDRLYSSVDELLFSPTPNADGERVLNDATLNNGHPAGILTPDLLDKTRFFLTAQSRSPELNLYGRPRITIWPVDTDTKKRTTVDNLITFCSTVGPDTDRRPFLFQRHDPYSATNDANIARNRTVYDYLRELTSQPVPGFGSHSFQDKYRTERNQILTEIQDYVRCVNLRDPSRTLDVLKAHGNPMENSAEWKNAQFDIEGNQFAPRGIVVPLKVNRDGGDTVGFGRISTINQAALVLYHAGYVAAKPDGQGGFNYLDPRQKEKRGVKANLIRAFLVLETFNPMQGYAGVRNAADSPKRAGASTGMDVADNNLYIHEITGLDVLKISSEHMEAQVPLGFPRRGRNRLYYASAGWHSRAWGGYEGLSHTLYMKGAIIPSGAAYPSQEYYPFQTDAPGVAVPAEDQFIDFSGGKVTVQAFFGNRFSRKIILNFPAARWPVPTDDLWLDEGGFDRFQGTGKLPWICSQSYGTWAGWPLDSKGDFPVKTLGGRIRWVYHNQFGSGANSPHTTGTPAVADRWETNLWRNIIQPGDVVRSLIASGKVDPRQTALGTSDIVFEPHPNYQDLWYDGQKGPDGLTVPRRQAHLLRVAAGVPYAGNGDRGDKDFQAWRGDPERRGTYGGYWPAAEQHPQMTYDYPVTTFGNLVALPAGKTYPSDKAANVPPTVNGVVRNDGRAADFDTGIANLPDGAYCGKADEGTNTWGAYDSTRNSFDWDFPYYERDREVFDSFFSANRQISSAVMFGSLPAGRDRPWETLNFCPNPAGVVHHGNDVEPKDHLLLDLFTMPIVQPYAISEPFSSAGKVNMNYQIAPFTYIHRSTAFRAALEAVRVPAVGVDQVGRYKSGAGSTNYRYLVDRDQMVLAADDYFAQFEKGYVDAGIFKSATQICERFLYPRNVQVQGRSITYDPRGDRFIRSFWDGQKLTGDNLRERPYADLLARLTTKSNTFTVHMRVQVLGKANRPGLKQDRWDEDKETIISEYRGSSKIERYLDPQDRRFDLRNPETQTRGDYLNPDKDNLESAYRFRVIYTKRFSPW